MWRLRCYVLLVSYFESGIRLILLMTGGRANSSIRLQIECKNWMENIMENASISAHQIEWHQYETIEWQKCETIKIATLKTAPKIQRRYNEMSGSLTHPLKVLCDLWAITGNRLCSTECSTLVEWMVCLSLVEKQSIACRNSFHSFHSLHWNNYEVKIL